MNLLPELLLTARTKGWASGTMPLKVLQYQMRMAGLVGVSSRPGQGYVDVLRPVDQSDAHKRSLSATFGTGAQPLHVDGAHLPEPVDIVILAASTPNPVATRLSLQDYWKSSPEVRDALAHGLFVVSDGQRQFLAPAWSMPRFRYDPGCMVPADARARLVVDYFDDARTGASAFEWDQPDQVLVINNRLVLHARDDATDAPDRELHRFMFRLARQDVRQ